MAATIWIWKLEAVSAGQHKILWQQEEDAPWHAALSDGCSNACDLEIQPAGAHSTMCLP